ncbi:MAG TPA: heavy metal translocating P-type ATPase [Bacilli bacterium]|nr:heavy metal translocating P-type ATPase [Bacilli bacterium]
MEQKFKITGMMCAGCVSNVETAVKKLDNVEAVEVNLLTNSLNVTYKNGADDLSVIQAVDKAGYKAEVAEEDNFGKNRKANRKFLKKNFIKLSAAIATLLVLMYFSMGHMLSWWLPYQDPLSLVVTQLILTLVIVAIYFESFIRGFKTLFSLHPNMDTLTTIGITAAIGYGLYSLVMIFVDPSNAPMYAMNVYFEAAAMILVFVSIGHYLEDLAKMKTKGSLEKLISLVPDKGVKLVGADFIEVPIEQIYLGDIVRVNPGGKVPLDGVIIEGFGDIDQSAITGEADPKFKTIGDEVIGATINRNGSFTYKVTREEKDSTLKQIIRLVENAAATKAPIAALADKIAGIFVPIILALALVVFAVWLFIGDANLAFNMGISVLVISCPCALGLATPVAVMVGSGKGAENGILFKNAKSIQALSEVDTVVFDKTGTLTNGFLEVNEVNFSDEDLTKVAPIIMGLETLNDHPLSKALIKYLENLNHVGLKNMNGNYIPGQGMVGEYKGKRYLVGNKKLLDQFSVKLTKIPKVVGTHIYVSEDDNLVGLFVLTDVIKESSYEAVIALRKHHKKVVLLTGDNRINAEALAKKVGIDIVYSDVLPEDKVNVIKKLKEDGAKVVMVGDGINDAPALETANVGIALGSGTQIAIESAGIILVNDAPIDVFKAINLADKVVSNIKWNLFWAFFYNIIMIPLAAGLFINWGYQLTPMIASIFMSLSSIFVVLNALTIRLRKLQ